MELSRAFAVKQQVFSALGLRSVRTRELRPRVSVGISASTAEAQDGFRIAIRARSQEELDRALGYGVENTVAELASSEIDVEITGPIVAALPAPVAAQPRRLSIGASVGHYLCTGGTLGFFARRNSDGVVGLVSNNHVLAVCDGGVEGDEVLHPSSMDGGVREWDVVAYLAGDYPRLDVEQPLVDCAFAPLRDGVSYDPASIAEGLRLHAGLVPIWEQDEVLKKGKTTGLTRGRIKAFAMDHCDVEYHQFGTVFFNQQIEIESVGDTPFSKPGDSGSLIVNPEGHPVALLTANWLDGRRQYANPIAEVLRALGVTLIA